MSGLTARAELLEDRGAAAVSDHFFRSRPFLDAEAATHTLRIETDDGLELVAPLLVREIPNAAPGADPREAPRDAISPYGYPGIVPSLGGRPLSRIPGQRSAAPAGLGLDPAAIDFSGTGLVSVFLRHTLGAPPLAATTERNVVQLADPALAPKSRPSDRRQVRRNLEAGYGLELVPGAETTPAQRAGFLDLYEQTMRRTAAAEHYFFAAAYFDRVLAADRTWLALASGPDGTLAAASIAAVSDGFLHYYLSGSADSHLRDSPMKNVVAALVEHAAALELPLNLGGGISPRRRAGGVQARLRQPRAGLAHVGARLRPRGLRPPQRRPPRQQLLPRLPRPLSAPPGLEGPDLVRVGGGGPGEGEGFDRLAAVLAPGRQAEGADRVQRRRALVGRAAEQVGPGGGRDLVGHLVVREQQRRRVHRVVEPLQFQLRRFRQVGRVLDRQPPVLERVDDVDFRRRFQSRRRRPAGREVRRGRPRSAGWSRNQALRNRPECVRGPRP